MTFIDHKKSPDAYNDSLSKPLRIGSLFSGIGAFEEALKQLGISHEIKFACDNGEIELIPFDDPKMRRRYKDLNKRVRSLTCEEKAEYEQLKATIAESIVTNSPTKKLGPNM